MQWHPDQKGYIPRMPIKDNAHYKILEISKNGVTEPYIPKLRVATSILLRRRRCFSDTRRILIQHFVQIPRQVRFFKDFDEIYWNVTGTEWDFMIEKADVTVKMPYPVKVINHSGYTGYAGEKEPISFTKKIAMVKLFTNKPHACAK